MGERIRELTVTIEIDTNKQTLRTKLSWRDGETVEELQKRVGEAMDDLLEQVS